MKSGTGKEFSDGLRHEVVRFALVGAAATCTHYLLALYAVLYLNVYVANLLGYLAAVAISYFGHQRYSFALSSRQIAHSVQFPKFILGSVGGLVLSYLVLATMEGILGSPHWISLAAAVCLVPLYTFIVNKYFVFKTARRSGTTTP